MRAVQVEANCNIVCTPRTAFHQPRHLRWYVGRRCHGPVRSGGDGISTKARFLDLLSFSTPLCSPAFVRTHGLITGHPLLQPHNSSATRPKTRTWATAQQQKFAADCNIIRQCVETADAHGVETVLQFRKPLFEEGELLISMNPNLRSPS